MPPDRVADMAPTQAPLQIVESLRSQCEECVECLKEIMAIHIKVNSPSRTNESTDNECSFRLGKVLLHVQAITGWRIETEVVHVIAPEIRCANKQLEKVLMSMPESFRVKHLGANVSIAGQIKQSDRQLREVLSGFVHPTPQRILLPIERGGFHETHEAPRFFFLFVMLMDLAVKYDTSVAYLSHQTMNGITAELPPVLEKVASIATTVAGLSVDQIFNSGK